MQHQAGGMMSQTFDKGLQYQTILIFSLYISRRGILGTSKALWGATAVSDPAVSFAYCFKRSDRAINKAFYRVREERKWNSCNSREEKAERESRGGGRRKANMPFGDFSDKLPSEGGCVQHVLCSVTQNWELFWNYKPISYDCAYNTSALPHLHLLRRSLPLWSPQTKQST